MFFCNRPFRTVKFKHYVKFREKIVKVIDNHSTHLYYCASLTGDVIISERSRYGGIAQLGERLHGMQEVSGSIPLISTKSNLL